jgi:methionine aminopeptidase
MEEGEVYAIETFGTTGRGNIIEDGECSHYMREFGVNRPVARQPGAVKLWNAIDKNFSTLAFCKRWLDEIGHKGHALALRQLVDSGSVNAYPPLVEARGAYTAQYEHTILLRPTCKEVLTRSYDY